MSGDTCEPGSHWQQGMFVRYQVPPSNFVPFIIFDRASRLPDHKQGTQCHIGHMCMPIACAWALL